MAETHVYTSMASLKKVGRRPTLTLQDVSGEEGSESDTAGMLGNISDALASSTKQFTPDTLTWSPQPPHLWSDFALPTEQSSSTAQTPQLSSRSTSSGSLHSLSPTEPSSIPSSSLSSPVLNSSEITPTNSDSEEDSDPRILSFPLKVAAFALALLPIPTSFFASYTNPPPLPVELNQKPKTFIPRHRSASSTTISPKASFLNLTSLERSRLNSNRSRKKVSFDKVVIVSPHESDIDEGDDYDE